MKPTSQLLQLLSQDHGLLDEVHNRSLDLLAEPGIRFHSVRAREILHGAGAEVDGEVHYGEIVKGSRKIAVRTDDGEEREYSIPKGMHVTVQEGERVRAGDAFTDGPKDPHKILEILGERELQDYLLDGIQEVYRLQGVNIHDKHIEVVIRQMMRWIKVEDPGDTDYLEGDQINRANLQASNLRIVKKVVIESPGDSKFKVDDIVDKMALSRENRKLRNQGLKEAEFRTAKPAIFKPILLGITQAALSTNSFISAASFQETTRVLTEAAIVHKSDKLLGLKESELSAYVEKGIIG